MTPEEANRGHALANHLSLVESERASYRDAVVCIVRAHGAVTRLCDNSALFDSLRPEARERVRAACVAILREVEAHYGAEAGRTRDELAGL